MIRLLLALLAALALAGCGPAAKVRPALWEVESPQGGKAWLFGTIHALPDQVDWRSDKVAAALAGSNRLVLEVAQINDDTAIAKTFASLAQGSAQPPLAERLPPNLRGALQRELAADAIPPTSLDRYDTWAAALMIEQAESRLDRQDSANGIDRALAASYPGRVEEFEGAAAQLAIFDRLPETQQRALLGAVLTQGADRVAKALALSEAWAKGDMAAIAQATDADFAADPALREALLVGRNRAWCDRLAAMLVQGAQPFVAVGAAHMAGADGLPAMLAARGWKVRRVQ